MQPVEKRKMSEGIYVVLYDNFCAGFINVSAY